MICIFCTRLKEAAKLLWCWVIFCCFGQMVPFFLIENVSSRHRRIINILIYGNRDILSTRMFFFSVFFCEGLNCFYVVKCVIYCMNWARKMRIGSTTRWWLSQINENNVGTIRRLSASFNILNNVKIDKQPVKNRHCSW